MTKQQLTELLDEYENKQDISDAYYNDALDIFQKFCDKLLKAQKPVPEDIQKIINEHFFEKI